MDSMIHILVLVFGFISITGCDVQDENGVVYEIRSEGFSNTMVVGEEAVEASLRELFELKSVSLNIDTSKERAMIEDLGGHIAYKRFLGSADPVEIADKFAEYGLNYFIISK